MVRRRPGTLLPIEVAILDAGLGLRGGGNGRFHGFELAKAISQGRAAQKLTSHGTLYKALGRLEDRGLLASEWEDPAIGAAEGRPRRRLYQVTGKGAEALAAWQLEHPRAAAVQLGLAGGA